MLNCSSSSTEIDSFLAISLIIISLRDIYLRARSQRTSSVVPSGWVLPLNSSIARWASSEASNLTTLSEYTVYDKSYIMANMKYTAKANNFIIWLKASQIWKNIRLLTPILVGYHLASIESWQSSPPLLWKRRRPVFHLS